MTKMSFTEPLKTGFTIYSKSGCVNCKKVKDLLKDKNHEFTIVDCDDYLLFDYDNFLLFLKTIVGKDYKTFPIVFYNGDFVGGYKETSILL